MNTVININYDSYMMPRKVSEEMPERMAFTFTPTNRKETQTSMQNKEFSSVSSLINTALTFYFENREKTSLTKEWLLSDEGKEFIKSLMRSVED